MLWNEKMKINAWNRIESNTVLRSTKKKTIFMHWFFFVLFFEYMKAKLWKLDCLLNPIFLVSLQMLCGECYYSVYNEFLLIHHAIEQYGEKYSYLHKHTCAFPFHAYNNASIMVFPFIDDMCCVYLSTTIHGFQLTSS